MCLRACKYVSICVCFMQAAALAHTKFAIGHSSRGLGTTKYCVLSYTAEFGQLQGSYRSWKTWKVMEYDNLDSRPGKSWNFGPGPGKSWNFMLANLYPAELPTVLDCLTYMREKY